MPADRIARFFSLKVENLHYQINKSLRESVVFAEQNLLNDLPFSQLDLVLCRNVMIYLKPDMQQKSIGVFDFALRSQDYLMLGSAVTNIADDEQHRIGRELHDGIAQQLTGGALINQSFREGLPKEMSTQIERIRQWIIILNRNSVKHAEAELVSVQHSLSDTFRLIVNDNGKGFETDQQNPKSNGLRIMQYPRRIGWRRTAHRIVSPTRYPNHVDDSKKKLVSMSLYSRIAAQQRTF